MFGWHQTNTPSLTFNLRDFCVHVRIDVKPNECEVNENNEELMVTAIV